MADTRTTGATSVRDYILLLIAAVLMLIALGCFWLAQRSSPGGGSPALRLGEALDVIDRGAQDVGRGAPPNFAAVAEQLKDAEADLQALRNGPPALQGDVAALTEAWKPVREAAGTLVAGEPAWRSASARATTIAGAAPALSASYEQIADRLASHGAPPGQIYLIASQLIRIERLQTAAARLLAGGNPQPVAEGLERESKTFLRNNRVLTEPVQGLDYTPVRDANVEGMARQAGAEFAPAAKAATDLAEDLPTLLRTQQAAAAIKASLPAAQNLQRRLALSRVTEGGGSGASGALGVLALIAGIAALLLVITFVVRTVATQRRREKLAAERDSLQQQAILRLLDEITNLANGDLTGDVTVTEDFTGAIADSINYTIQTLRELVGTINRTSQNIFSAASSTRDTAARMSQDSNRQAREIADAATAITATSGQLTDVAARAERIAVQAQTSMQIAHGGAGTVGRTIQSMAALREQIQDTAKRIKRLGESSQEIGNITELINDIAEQTNTLALNASIQAAMAGDAGRGFAVVADEVQRLAERATSATRQIENLVKTIQADTNEAIISMERSTANVVSGAKSAEEAGQSLTRVEASSQELAKSIQDISMAARAQSAEANKVAGVMQGIRDIAVQTSDSAGLTSEAVGELNTLSDKLRESVAGFTLPQQARQA